MHPAFSVIFLTTLIGAGQGLLLALVTGQWYFVIGATPDQESGAFYAGGAAIAELLLVLGLVASFFHLANPQRAWRTATRWRTSWLSREVIVLPAVMGATFLYGVVHWFGWTPVLWTFGNQKSLDLSMAVGFAAAGAALALFLCTAMIYASVKFIREWASSWTVVNYTLMGLASGFTIAAAYASLAGSSLTEFFAGDALALTLAAMAARIFQLWRNTRLKCRSSMKTAIGVHHGQIRQISQGFLGGSYNTTEYRHGIGSEVVRGLVVLFLFLAFALPAALVAAGWATGEHPMLLLAALVQYVGLMVERWVFFAQGNHVQNMYYQRMA
ncbi:DmsC/YnfH family molybdoenzyme membrane anchor subunit [Magnetospirillum sp. UT-4]|uniref:dimethyl sulfoxide reductase anchor subunit family protein n=1 Tax=Magnetospirillum sp. UT-4 TaxID=2681467 RepID=UPI00137E0175|nr:DmsC/YnfH family molybdoenzyme membrane anchor subunit [Magnetospirillum sp. UT-4]CAA7621480.1 DMSO reductase anchor subunit [Magnetospirillum sp. UT-4]